jgi:parallel beta-helix repeat protein/predicted outer membrane repeat protein
MRRLHRARQRSLSGVFGFLACFAFPAWAGSPGPKAGTAPGYVIITTNTIAATSKELDRFVAHKQARGFCVEVVRTDPNDPNWYAVGAAPERIRDWLKQHYLDSNIEYVLLIGNPDPNNADPNDAVPMKAVYPNEEVPTDIYYADLTGEWDLDGDGIPGVFPTDYGAGGADRYWEVLVGRIPCYASEPNWMDDVDSILRRTIAYQTQDPNTIGWRKRVLLPAMPISDEMQTYRLCERIKDDILIPEGWSYHRMYDTDHGLVPPPETVETTFDKVTDVWRSQPFGLVVWWTHGSPKSASEVMNVEHVPLLSDTHPSFTFQCSCLTAHPETTNNLAYELLKHGAICTVGATRPSFYMNGQSEFDGTRTSAGIAYEYAARLVVARLSSGQALLQAKRTMVPTMALEWADYALFNLYGDPDTYLIPPEAVWDRVHNQTQDRWYHDIQPAIDGANQMDVIILSPDRYTGPGNQDIDFKGKAITLRSTNPYDPNVVSATIVDAAGSGRGFRFHSGEGPESLLLGLTITGGSGDYGGAISFDQSSPIIRYCTIYANTAGVLGGAIYCSTGSNPGIWNCTLTDNSAGSAGGAIYCASSGPNVVECTITGNVAGSFGGGIVCYDSSNPKIARCRLSGNRAGFHGGAVLCYGDSSPSITDSMITGNSSTTVAGAIYLHSYSNPTFRHCTFSGNSSPDYGGAIHCYQGSNPVLSHCILWGDAAANGAELALRGASGATFSYCDVMGGPDGVYTEPNCILLWGEGNIQDDPLFVDPYGPDGDANTWADNDYHISDDSPCVEGGDPNSGTYLGEMDFELERRFMGKIVDIGADESSSQYGKCGECGNGVELLAPLLGLGSLYLLRRRG